MSDLSPAAYDALAHAVWGGLADAGIAYEHRFELAEVILDEMVGVFAEEGIRIDGAKRAIQFAFDASRRAPVSAA
ncbi:MAG: hypothetical protein R3D59_05800 [Paracoccaceae bacterium]